jgi:hypothetical protein
MAGPTAAELHGRGPPTGSDAEWRRGSIHAVEPPKVIGMRQQFPGIDNLW